MFGINVSVERAALLFPGFKSVVVFLKSSRQVLGY
jgi:hypothetical protein